MKARYVALDTETTGLNPEQDEIIEVAAIAFDRDGVLGEFDTLVRPRRLPSFQVQRLTGIDPSLLESAPGFAAVASELAEFVGDSPVVGQSVHFDVDFLARAGVPLSGAVYDTYDLAQVLLPGLSDYSLRAIAEHLRIDFPTRHRARADAEAARLVFLQLRQRLAELPPWLLHEVLQLATLAEWPLALLLQEVLRDLPSREPGATGGLTAELLARPEEIGRPLNGTRPAAPVQPAEVLGLLSRAGSLTDFLPVFERRQEQEAMAAAVTRALSEGHHLLVEAGTGTGKSLAYLLPAALQALRAQERVVVSTDTIGLQEQLVGKDLPAVRALLGQREGEPLRFAALKGRRNYLCLQRWTNARHLPPASKEDARLLARVLVWLTRTQTGDRAELNLHSSLDAAWGRISADNSACSPNTCPFVRQGTCFPLRAHRRAEAAHVVVVNHALLLSDVVTGGHVLPPYSRLVIDEAHNLEDEATARFAFRASEGDIADFLDRVGRRGSERAGIAGSLAEAVRGSDQLLGPGAYIAGLGSALVAAAGRCRQRLGEPFRLLVRVLRECTDEDQVSDDRLLVKRSTRVQPLWSDVQIAAQKLDEALASLTGLLDDLRAYLEAGEQGLMNQEALASEAAELWQTGCQLQEGLARALLEEDASLICWLERSRQTGEVGVCTAPLEVSDILRQDVFEARESVVLTSATLSAENSFDYLRQRVGLDDAEELLLGSPFDFLRSTLIALPSDMPEPNDPEFVQSVSELLIESVRASGGRALVLFTAYGMLNAVYEAIKAPLESEGILVLGHGVDGSPRQMLASLRENSRTVLLGTASFWEGVDVAGEALSLLVIVRLPFAVPSDPIYQARSALYDEPFEQYALPQAVLRFRQGFGRLIRTKTDRGVLLVLDRRIRSRKYGEAFLKSIPRCTLKELASREVPAAVESWLA